MSKIFSTPQRGLRVIDHGSVDDVGQPPFEAPQGFLVALPGGAFALVVDASSGVSLDLCDRHDVEGVVELPVAGAGQAMALHVTGGDLYGCDASE